MIVDEVLNEIVSSFSLLMLRLSPLLVTAKSNTKPSEVTRGFVIV